MRRKSKIKPCPFCGDSATYDRYSGGICCTNADCGARIPHPRTARGASISAIDRWNARAGEQKLRRRYAKLKAKIDAAK
jgi:hypothetical protein